ncbi:MAG: delta-60 repeat domain-containing protein [Nocardioidaceae bacterium]|nr:delta-60 repeat domain-containing protein [Nocardioidaceae bacterium]
MRQVGRALSLTAAGLLVTSVAGVFAASGAAASLPPHGSVVSEDPVNYTPNLVSNTVVSHPAIYALAQSGSTLFAGGAFNAVENSNRTTTYTRTHIMSFSATSGAMTSFAPTLNGPVWTIVADGSSVYVGGQFTTVNGVARRGIVKLNATTGAVDTSFNASLNSGKVNEARLVNGRLIIGGTFSKKLMALNPTTGADTGFINVPITGSVAANAGSTDIYRFAVNPAGDRLVALGNFTSVAGQTRYRAFMLTLGPTAATLNPWYYQPLENMCRAVSLPAYLRDVDFSPDGSYFVFVSTGFIPNSGGEGRDLCDATARFETNIASPPRPTWINYTGGDTLHSVAVTGAAVYVQGHQRWLNNGAVERPGIGAIDPTTGLANSWNPTKTRAVGGKDLFVTSAGLWVGSDGKRFNGEYRYGIAFSPL